MSDSSAVEKRWMLGGSVVIAAILLFLYGRVFQGLMSDWYHYSNDSHGFLVPFISAYFIWERWDALKSEKIMPNLLGAGVLCVGLFCLAIGLIGTIIYLQRLSFLIVLGGLVLLILGRRHLWILSLPIGFLIFMIPLPDLVVNTIAFPLQLFAAKTASFCLFSLGIPVLREGNLIILARTTLEVAEACSGLRSLLALLALGTVYGYFSQDTVWKRWVLVFLSVPIAILANAVRVSGTGILAHYFGIEAAEGFYHTFEGWIVFVVAFVLLFFCGLILGKIGKRSITPLSSI